MSGRRSTIAAPVKALAASAAGAARRAWIFLGVRLGGRGRLLLISLAAILAGVVVIDRALPPPLDRADRLATLVVDKDGQWLRAIATPEGRWRFRADLDALDPEFVRRIVAVEDKRFWSHWGVDPAAMLRAAGGLVRSGRVASGGSTITMQVARLLEPRPRTVPSKIMEMIRALQIEARLSKREILEIYLTLAPYGGALEGVRAASLTYFGREPVDLTDAEMALLAALPQAPEARRPDRRPLAARRARDRLLTRFVDLGLIDARRADEGAQEALPTRTAYRVRAFHAADELARTRRDAVTRGLLATTLDARLQTRIEGLAATHAASQGEDVTAAILVVEVGPAAVRAAVGSAGLDKPGGWIDMTTAQRSPGSTLKPFIYGLAMDEGLLAPATILDDSPTRFDGYLPENFDKKFHGVVSAATALQHSLNVPAVSALSALGAERFDAALKAAGADPRLPRRAGARPGLPIALGGVGLTARDLVLLYAALANDGGARPLAWTPQETEANLKRPPSALMSAQSARKIGEILRASPSPGGRAPSWLAADAPRVAFKTGTSYGYRDAWAAGYAGGWVVVAWIGRADGAARAGVTGRDAALPLLFDVFDQLAVGRDADPEAERVAPQGLERLVRRASPAGPVIVFPPDGAEIAVTGFGSHARGVAFAGRGEALDWYVDGLKQPAEPTSGRVVWRPEGPGFYEVRAVDMQGRSAQAKVRVKDAF